MNAVPILAGSERSERLALLHAGLDRLPQSSRLAAGHRRAWAEAAIERPDWQAVLGRLAGFLPSEIGSLAMNWRQVTGYSHAARRIVSDKLCMSLPASDDETAARKNRATAHVRDMTMTQLGAVADSATLQAGAWRFPKRNSPADWMIAAGFDLLLIGAKRYLAHNHVLQGREVADILRHGVPFDWAAALQQNRTVLEASGIAIEAALIVIFDTNSWRVLPQVVAKDEQLERAIIDAGNHYWNNHVLRGELPPYIGRPLLQPGLNVPPALRQAARNLMVVHSLQQVLDDRSATLSTSITDWVRQAGDLGETVLVVEDMHVLGSMREYRVEEMADRLRHLGGDPEKHRAEGEMDIDALIVAARAAGIDVEAFRIPGDVQPEALLNDLSARGEDPSRYYVEHLTVEMSPAAHDRMAGLSARSMELTDGMIKGLLKEQAMPALQLNGSEVAPQ